MLGIVLRANIAKSEKTSHRYRRHLLRQTDELLLAIVEACDADPEASIADLHADLRERFPGLVERTIYELSRITDGRNRHWRHYGAERRRQVKLMTDHEEQSAVSVASLYEPPWAALAQEPEHVRRQAIEDWRRQMREALEGC